MFNIFQFIAEQYKHIVQFIDEPFIDEPFIHIIQFIYELSSLFIHFAQFIDEPFIHIVQFAYTLMNRSSTVHLNVLSGTADDCGDFDFVMNQPSKLTEMMKTRRTKKQITRPMRTCIQTRQLAGTLILSCPSAGSTIQLKMAIQRLVHGPTDLTEVMIDLVIYCT
jgi:hypothetical protein